MKGAHSMKEVNGIKDIDFAFILEYVKEQGPDAIQWLKDLKNKPVPPDKNGRERKMSFIELRKEFVIKYFPKLAPKPKEKKLTMWEQIDAL